MSMRSDFCTFFRKIHLITAKLIKRDEGHFITGRGCGLSTPMRYLKEIPQNLEDYECSFIPIKTNVGFCSDGIESCDKIQKGR